MSGESERQRQHRGPATWARDGGPRLLTPGTTFAGHRIEAVIGSGGMGVVYRARHLALDRERALKVVAPKLSADQRFRERFKRESRLAAQVEHPNVIPVHHAGEEGGQLYLAMRLVDGVDLRSLVDGSGPLDTARAVRRAGRDRRRPRRGARQGPDPS